MKLGLPVFLLIITVANACGADAQDRTIATFNGGVVTELELFGLLQRDDYPIQRDSHTWKSELASTGSLVRESAERIAWGKIIQQQVVSGHPPKHWLAIDQLRIRRDLEQLASELLSADVGSSISVTDSEVTVALAQAPDNLMQPATAKVALAFLESPDKFPHEAQRLLALKQEKDPGAFERTVQELASRPGPITGAIYDRFTTGSPALQQAVFTSPIGEVSGPISTPKGMFMIKVLERRPRTLKSDAESAVRSKLIQSKRSHEISRRTKAASAKRGAWSWDKATLPTTGSEVVIRVGDFSVTFDQLLSVYGGEKKILEAEPVRLSEITNQWAADEAVLQELLESSKHNNPLLYFGLGAVEARSYGMLYESAYFDATTTVPEQQAREYYEQYKTSYHAGSPRAFMAVVVDMPKFQSRVEAGKWRSSVEGQLRALSGDGPKRSEFTTRALSLAKKDPRFHIERFGPVLEFPKALGTNLSTQAFGVGGKISDVMTSGDQLLVFQCINEEQPVYQNFEQVKGQPWSVVIGQARRELAKRLRDEALKEHDFKIVLK